MEVVSLTWIATSMYVGIILKNFLEQFALRGLIIGKWSNCVPMKSQM